MRTRKQHAVQITELHVRTSSTAVEKHKINFTGNKGTHNSKCSTCMATRRRKTVGRNQCFFDYRWQTTTAHPTGVFLIRPG